MNLDSPFDNQGRSLDVVIRSPRLDVLDGLTILIDRRKFNHKCLYGFWSLGSGFQTMVPARRISSCQFLCLTVRDSIAQTGIKVKDEPSAKKIRPCVASILVAAL
jgi:hypothetical protein